MCDKTKGYPLKPDQYEPNKRWFSPAFEYYKMTNEPFEVNHDNLAKLQAFKKEDNEAFKFIIFKLDHTPVGPKPNEVEYIYAIHGTDAENKHPCCYLQAVKDHASDLTPKYQPLINAINAVDQLRARRLNNETEAVTEQTTAIVELNAQIFNMMGCMEVDSAGSGTMIDDKICINNKSGHFKPTLCEVEPYTKLFAERTGLKVYAEEQASNETIVNFLRARHLDVDTDGRPLNEKDMKRLISNKSGICMSDYKPRRAIML